MKSLVPVLIKSAIFVLVTVLAAGVLLITISSPGSGTGGKTYSAMFTDVTSLNTGDDIRMAGVRVGQVTGISIKNRREAKVSFTVESNVVLAATVTATIRFRSLIGQRYIELDQGAGSPANPWPSGRTLTTARTSPALDLTALFNGFQPLFQALDATQINRLSYEIIQIFQGEGTTVDDLLTQTASLTSTLADKDAVIGKVVDNLNSVLKTVNAHQSQLSTTVTTLSQLVSGLSQDRAAIGSAITGIGGLTTSVSSLLQQGRPALQTSIESLGALSANLDAQMPTVRTFLKTAPTKLNNIGRLASYGSWVNLYLCSLTGKIPVPSGYSGGVGAQPVESRCQG